VRVHLGKDAAGTTPPVIKPELAAWRLAGNHLTLAPATGQRAAIESGKDALLITLTPMPRMSLLDRQIAPAAPALLMPGPAALLPRPASANVKTATAAPAAGTALPAEALPPPSLPYPQPAPPPAAPPRPALPPCC
jgi:hypothetical protein